ncbi:hypothetical protein LZK73_17320 [Neorhizobium galegae]|nr:hypothetical protein LZK73_17320 [Neorhizobium galegae]
MPAKPVTPAARDSLPTISAVRTTAEMMSFLIMAAPFIFRRLGCRFLDEFTLALGFFGALKRIAAILVKSAFSRLDTEGSKQRAQKGSGVGGN